MIISDGFTKISDRLKYLRLEKGLTQDELAKALNLGQSTVAAYEKGQHEPQIFSLIAYADYFGCTVDYLVGYAEKDITAETYTETENKKITQPVNELASIYLSLSAEKQKTLLNVAKALKNS